MVSRPVSKAIARAASVVVEALERRQLLSAELVKDINVFDAGSSPTGLTSYGGAVYFAASNSSSGNELWRTDGTSTGTYLVKDINPGSADAWPTNFTVANGLLFFSATTATGGIELWRTDGTTSGTVLVKDIRTGAGSSTPASLTAMGDNVYFTANDGIEGVELWSSDGTAANTQLLKAVNPGTTSSTFSNLYAWGDQLFFGTGTSSTGAELWISDGTTSGTVLVKDINPGSAAGSPTGFAPVGTRLYFAATTSSAGNELWSTDGTALGTRQEVDLNAGTASASPSQLKAYQAGLVFSATTAAQGQELWRFDPASGTASIVYDAMAGAASGAPFIGEAVGGSLYFATTVATTGPELYVYDGTQVQLVKDIYPGTVGGVRPWWMVSDGSRVYFAASAYAHDWEVWRSDGSSAGTQRVADLYPGTTTSNASKPVLLGGTFLFAASSSAYGRELFSFTATTSGLVQSIREGTYGSNPTNLRRIGDRLWFTADATFAEIGSTNEEPFVTDMASGETELLKEINYAGPSLASDYVQLADGRTIFAAGEYAGNGPNRELWVSDGTTAGTSELLEIKPGGGASISNLLRVGDIVYFSADDGVNGVELWKTDGTAAGTVLVKDVNPGAAGSTISGFFSSGGLLYFVGNSSIYTPQSWQVFRSDGTAAGTYAVRANTISPLGFLAGLDGKVYFVGSQSQGRELWSYDPVSGSCEEVADISPGGGSSDPATPVVLGGAIYFSAATATGGRELYKYSPATGAVLIKDIEVGSGNSLPQGLVSYNGVLYFSADVSGTGRELWRTDGTAAGTYLVADIAAGAGSSNPTGFVISGRKLYFSAYDETSGTELWTTDGTESGTYCVGDINPGTGSSNPLYLTNGGGTLYFSANDGVYGAELWQLGTLESPQGVQALNTGDSELTISWDAPVDSALQASISWSVDGADFTTPVTLATGVTSYTIDSSLSPGSDVIVQICFIDLASGDHSSYSSTSTTLAAAGGDLQVRGLNGVGSNITLSTSNGVISVITNDVERRYSAEYITSIHVVCYDGFDFINAAMADLSGIAFRFEGGAGNDTIIGAEGGGVLDGGYGDDSIDGGSGNDTLLGGLGRDTLNGGAGNDALYGSAGNDWLLNDDAEDDTLVGGDGTDYTQGINGDTVIDSTGIIVAINGPALAYEGTPYVLDLGSSGSLAGTITQWTIDWGDGTTETIEGNPSTATHTYADGPCSPNVAAQASGNGWTFATPRLALDRNFGMDGSTKIENAFEGRPVPAPDGGAFVFITDYENGNVVQAVARLDPDGVSLTTFNEGQRLQVPSNQYLRGIAVTSDGGVILAGTEFGEAVHGFVSRYGPNGMVDATYATALSDDLSEVLVLAVDHHDRAIIVQSDWVDDGNVVRLRRFRPDGSPDAAFGVGGVVTLGPSTHGFDTITNIGVSPDDSVYVGGSTSGMLGVIHVLASGEFDAGFAGDGVLNSSIEISVDGLWMPYMAVTRDGRPVVAGKGVDSSGATQLQVSRHLVGGEPDSTFGNAGTVTYQTGGDGGFYGFTLDPLGRTVLLKWTYSFTTGDSATTLERLRSDGSTDATFGDQGRYLLIDGEVSSVEADVYGRLLLISGMLNENGPGLAVRRFGHVVVNDVAPNIELLGDSAVRSGDPFSLSVAITDPGSDTVASILVDWGDYSDPDEDGHVGQIITDLSQPVEHTYENVGNYTIHAAVSDEDGTYTAPTLELAVGMPPSTPPSGVAVAAGSATSITVSWTAALGNVESYLVERQVNGGEWEEVDDVPADVNEYTDYAFVMNAEVNYRVSAQNQFGSSLPAAAPTPIITGNGGLDAPVGVAAEALSPNSAVITWTDASAAEHQFLLEASANGGAFTTIGSAPENANSFVALGLVDGTPYQFRVSAVAPFGASAPASSSIVTTSMLSPTPLVVTIGGAAAYLEWADLSAGEEYYKIQYRLQGGEWQSAANGARNSMSATVSGLEYGKTYDFQVRAMNAETNSPWAKVAGMAIQSPAAPAFSANVHSETAIKLGLQPTLTDLVLERSVTGYDQWTQVPLTQLSPGIFGDATVEVATTYFYRARWKVTGTEAGFLPIGTQLANSAVVSASTWDTIPTILDSVIVDSSGVHLGWVERSATEYRIEYSTDGTTYSTLGTVSGDTPTYLADRLPADQYFFFRVVVVSESSASTASNVVGVWTSPAAPTDLSVSQANANEVNLSWSDNSTSETGFRISVSTNGGAYVHRATTPANSTGWSLGGLAPNTTYSFRLEAIGEDGNSTAIQASHTLTPTSVVRGIYFFDASDSKIWMGQNGTFTVSIDLEGYSSAGPSVFDGTHVLSLAQRQSDGNWELSKTIQISATQRAVISCTDPRQLSGYTEEFVEWEDEEYDPVSETWHTITRSSWEPMAESFGATIDAPFFGVEIPIVWTGGFYRFYCDRFGEYGGGGSVSIDSYDVGDTSQIVPEDYVPPSVWVSTTESIVKEKGSSTDRAATIRINRSGETGLPLTVMLHPVAGTATPGVDYSNPFGTEVIIPAGSTSVELTVTATSDEVLESDEVVGVAIKAAAAYRLSPGYSYLYHYQSITIDEVNLDIDVDSNNDGEIEEINERVDDAIETEGIGHVVVASGDLDRDGVPGFADGIDRNSGSVLDDASPARLSELRLKLPEETGQVTFDYLGSAPSDVTWTGDGSAASPYRAQLDSNTPGCIRIWAIDETLGNPGSLLDSSIYTYIEPYRAYTYGELSNKRFFIQAVKPTATEAQKLITATMTLTIDGNVVSYTDTVKLTPSNLDLDGMVRPDTTMGLTIDRSDRAEEDEEGGSTRPGQVLIVNDADRDLDGVPDFADGFDGNPSPSARFSPLRIELPVGFNVERGSLFIAYAPEGEWLWPHHLSSEPGRVQSVGTAVSPAFSPAAGVLRLWTKDGNADRSKRNALIAAGDFVGAGVYSGESLKRLPIVTEEGRSYVQLWVEAVSSGTAAISAGASLSRVAPEAMKFTDSTTFTAIRAIAPEARGELISASDASFLYESQDFDLSGWTENFGHGLLFTNAPEYLLATGNDGAASVSDWPQLISAGSSMMVLIGGRSYFFDFVPENPNTPWKARFAGHEKLVQDAQSGDFKLVTDRGETWILNGFDEPLEAAERGRFKQYVSAGGQVVSVAATDADGRITMISRGQVTIEYAYVADPSDDSWGKLKSVTATRGATSLYEVAYEYYGVVGGFYSYGNPNDVKTVVIKRGTNEIEKKRFFYTMTDPDKASVLLCAIEGSNYVRAEADGLSPFDVVGPDTLYDYATFVFDPGSSPISGSVYTPETGTISSIGVENPAKPIGPNAWFHKQVRTVGSSLRATQFTNAAGQPMLLEERDLTTGETHLTHYRYDDKGLLVQVASSLAVAAYDVAEQDLVGYHFDTDAAFLRGDVGLYTTYQYDADNLLKAVWVRSGESLGDENVEYGTKLRELTYDTVGTDSIFQPKTITLHTGESPSTRVTEYFYSNPAHNLPTKVVTKRPDGIFVTKDYNVFGRLEFVTDADGYINHTKWDNELGEAYERITDEGSAGTHLNLKTTVTQVDEWGRPNAVRDAMGRETYFNYTDTLETKKTTITLVGGRTQELTSSWEYGFEQTLAKSGTTIIAAERNRLDYAGRVVCEDRYFAIPTTDSNANDWGTQSARSDQGNFHRVSYVYDALGRLTNTTDAVGTNRETTYDAFDRARSLKVGTTLTHEIQYKQDPTTGTSYTITRAIPGTSLDRYSTDYYDWRGRHTATENGVQLLWYTYNNLDEQLTAEVFDNTRNRVNGVLSGVAIRADADIGRVARTSTEFTSLGQPWRIKQHAIDATGTASDGLVTTTTYDGRGNVELVVQPGGLVVQTLHDGAGREWYTSVGDGTQAGVLEETITSFNAAGNASLRKHVSFSGTYERVESVGYWYDELDRPLTTVNFGKTSRDFSQPADPPSRENGDGNDSLLRIDHGYAPDGSFSTDTDASGNVTYRTLDALGRKVDEYSGYTGGAISADKNRRTSFVVDGLGRDTEIVEYVPTGGTRVTTTTYENPLTLKPTRVQHPAPPPVAKPDGTSVPAPIGSYTDTFQYNQLGELTVQHDSEGPSSQTFKYDAVGRLIEEAAVITAMGTKAIDGTVRSRKYEYDALNRAYRLTSLGRSVAGNAPVVNQVKRVYDSFGNVVADYQESKGVVNPNTRAVRYEYELANDGVRLKRMVYPTTDTEFDAGQGRSLWYGYVGDDAEINRVSHVSDSSTGDSQILESYTYLGLSRVVGKSRPLNDGDAGAMATTQGGSDDFGLDRFGRLSTLTWSVGGSSVYSQKTWFDANSNVLVEEDGVRSQLSELYHAAAGDHASVAYDDLNQLKNWSRGTLQTVGSASRPNAILGNALNPQSWGTNEIGKSRRNMPPDNEKDRPTFQGDFDNSLMKSRMQEFSNANGHREPRRSLAIKFDAFGNLTRVENWWMAWIGYDTATLATRKSFTYDALNRRLNESVTGGNNHHQQSSSLYYYDTAGNVVEERQFRNGSSSLTQYVWGPANGQLVLRDRDFGGATGTANDYVPAGIDQRLYAITDAEGNVSVITSNVGTVLERFAYSPEGKLSIFADAATTPKASSDYDWTMTYKSGRQDGEGVYFTRDGEWDYLSGSTLEPDSLSYWDAALSYEAPSLHWGHKLNIIVTGTALAVVVTLATAGTATPYVGATAAGIGGLFMGGATMGLANSYAAGNSGGRLALDAGVSGVFAVASAGVGSAVSARLGSGLLNWMATGAVGMGTYGGLDGGYQGYMNTRTLVGTLQGAAEGALVGSATGAAFGAGLYGLNRLGSSIAINNFIDEMSQLPVKGYLWLAKGRGWRSFYNSFAPGTARLRFSLGGGKTLYRTAGSERQATFGEFGSVERPSTPVQAILDNALHPRVVGRGFPARFLYKVQTKGGFYVEGIAAQQGSFPGGNHQVFKARFLWRHSPWRSVQYVGYGS